MENKSRPHPNDYTTQRTAKHREPSPAGLFDNRPLSGKSTRFCGKRYDSFDWLRLSARGLRPSGAENPGGRTEHGFLSPGGGGGGGGGGAGRGGGGAVGGCGTAFSIGAVHLSCIVKKSPDGTYFGTIHPGILRDVRHLRRNLQKPTLRDSHRTARATAGPARPARRGTDRDRTPRR